MVLGILAALGAILASSAGIAVLEGSAIYLFFFQTEFGNFILLTLYGLGFFALQIGLIFIYAKIILFVKNRVIPTLEARRQADDVQETRRY